MPKVNEDSRGLFVELVKGREQLMELAQISYLTITPGSFRGQHYHLESVEAFILLEGDCTLIIAHADSSSASLKMTPFEAYKVLPREEHSLLSKKGAKILVLSSKDFDPNNPDTYVYGK